MVQAEEQNNVVNITATNTELYALEELARAWAVKTDGLINNDDYSSKYYAQQSKSAYEDTKTTADTAITNINTLTSNFEALADEQSAELLTQYNTYSENLVTTQNTALSSITTAQETAITAVETAQSTAETAIATDKETALSDISTAKTNFDTNAATLLSDYNANAAEKLTAYNDNDTSKTTAYNTNAAEKLSAYNNNDTAKTTAYNTNAETALTTYNTNAAAKIAALEELSATKTSEYTTLSDTKESSLTALSESKETELNTLADTLQSEITATGTTTQDSVNTTAQTAVNNIDTSKADAETSIAETVTSAKTEITTAKTEAVNAINDLAENIPDVSTLALKTDLDSYVSKTDSSASVIDTTKTLQKISGNQLYAPNGILFGGTARDAGLVTRGICGITTPKASGECYKENLYINYDGDNTYERQLILSAASVGTKIENTTNGYTYGAIRGDDMVQYVTAAVSGKADSATTLSGYGITDAYTKTEVDDLIGDISTVLDTINGESV